MFLTAIRWHFRDLKYCPSFEKYYHITTKNVLCPRLNIYLKALPIL